MSVTLCNVYDTVDVLKNARSKRDLEDIKRYCDFAQGQKYGPMANAPVVPENVCNCPYGYRTLNNAYVMSAGPFNMSMGVGNNPLNLQYYMGANRG